MNSKKIEIHDYKKEISQAILPKNWVILSLSQSLIENKQKKPEFIPKSEYKDLGKYPIIDQSSAFISGFTDDEDRIISYPLPTIIFGDHTRIFKFVNFPFAIGAQGTKLLFPNTERLVPKYLYYYFLQLEIPSRGYSRHYQFLKEFAVLTPPLPEQHLIVQKIEELFTDTNAGIQALEKAKMQIKKYKQVVLKLAIQGKLVQQDLTNEPALKLIEIIRVDLKEITKDKIDEKKTVSINSESNLFELPNSWIWVRLGELLTFGPKYGYSPKPVKNVTNVRSITLTATTSGKFRDDCFKYIDEAIEVDSHLWLQENDILIQRGNTIEGSVAKIILLLF